MVFTDVPGSTSTLGPDSETGAFTTIPVSSATSTRSVSTVAPPTNPNAISWFNSSCMMSSNITTSPSMSATVRPGCNMPSTKTVPPTVARDASATRTA